MVGMHDHVQIRLSRMNPYTFYSIVNPTTRSTTQMYKYFNYLQLEDDLESYDDHVFSRFKHTWIKDEMRKENIYFTSPSYGIDANTTFNVSIACVLIISSNGN